MGSIPFVIGITGHRDLKNEDIPTLTLLIREQFTRWMRLCPHTDFYCMTSLAEGADQLCGSIALEVGMRLLVPLPMEKSLYERDFSGEALIQFRALLSRAERVFIAPDIERRDDGESDYAYRKAGIYLSQNCHVLLALWDGKPGESGCCGTAETVAFRTQKRYHSPDSLLNTLDEGIALQIVTPRASGEKVPESALTLRWLGERSALDKMLRKTDAYNQDAARLAAGIPAHAPNEAAAQSACQSAETLRQIFVCADALALRYRDIYLILIKLLCAVGALLVACFLFYDELEANLFLIIYGCFALITFAAFRFARRGGIHEKYIEYRLFSETLRVQRQLYAAGIQVSVADLTSWSQRTICPWVHAAVNALQLIHPQSECARADVRSLWLKQQLDYQTASYQANCIKQKHQNKISGILLFATILFFAVVLVLEYHFPAWIAREISLPQWFCMLFQTHGTHFFSARGILKILLGLVPAFTFVVTSYYGKLSLARKRKDGARMITLYTKALQHYDDPEIDRVRLLTELAQEELAETGGWFSYVSENTPDMLI